MQPKFESFRRNIIGQDLEFLTPYGKQKLVYADWIASGRLYKPIEKKMMDVFGPYVGNTHTETNITGTTMTEAYHHAQHSIKRHCNAGPNDVIIMAGSGMTTVINKFQRMLGLRIPEQLLPFLSIKNSIKPVVFITHMEHHSNHTSWLETIADVVVIPPDANGLVSPENLEREIKRYPARRLKIGAFTAASNVTGIQPPYYELAKIMHHYGGHIFVDFACSAPYVDINMHPEDENARLDAVMFSPHKFLGGPGTPGVLIFNADLYHNRVPDNPGGGTVDWTNPWGEHRFISDIEAREDGGTPAFLQTIRTQLAIELKNKMGTEAILMKEHLLVDRFIDAAEPIKGLHILAGNIRERLGAISLYIDGIHYNLIVKLLNDRFGIQVRGGCSCAGTYGHYLLNVTPEKSHSITEKIDHGDLSEKPGWVRVSLHPTMTTDDVDYIADALKQIARYHGKWSRDYCYSTKKNEFFHKTWKSPLSISEMFTLK